MTITVSVDATWRVWRVEIDTPHDEPGTVVGFGEVLVAEPNKKTSDTFGTGKPYGAIPGANIARDVEDVMDATVTISGGTEISWRTVMEALPLFFEMWRAEDIENPPDVITPPGKGADLTPVANPGEKPVGPEGLPPPVL